MNIYMRAYMHAYMNIYMRAYMCVSIYIYKLYIIFHHSMDNLYFFNI